MPFLLQGVMLRNSTSKEPLAHLHSVMILLLSLDLITSVQRMREGGRKGGKKEGVCQHAIPFCPPASVSIAATSPITDLFFVHTLWARCKHVINKLCKQTILEMIRLPSPMCVNLAVKAIWEIFKTLLNNAFVQKNIYIKSIFFLAPWN